jgi:hypothetical protein
MGWRLIEYPDEGRLRKEAEAHDLEMTVLVRDLVRIVEVLNLKQKAFFSDQAVLSGSMALRCYNSPRFTVYDADFATAKSEANKSGDFRKLLTYEDDDLQIWTETSARSSHDKDQTAWKFEPVQFDPVFVSGLIPDEDTQFKVDLSNRGLVLPGVELPLKCPYDLGLWDEDPTVWIMDPHEIVAEKTLGWCVRRRVKHYADLAFIAILAHPERTTIRLNPSMLRETLERKLVAMKELQPDTYEPIRDIDELIQTLNEKNPLFDSSQWLRLVYVQDKRGTFSQRLMVKAVRELLVPIYKGS